MEIFLIMMIRGKETKHQGIISYGSYGKAFIKETLSFPEKIYISKKNTNKSFPGDLVSLKIKFSNKKKRWEGRVINIIERRKKKFVGVLEISENYAFVNITEKNIYTDFFLSQESLKNYTDGDKVIVEFLDWPRGNKSPFGKLVASLGGAGEYDTEIKSILFENGIKSEFPQKAIEDLEKIHKNSKEKRIDLRDEVTFTIDPVTAKDFDDAISFKKLEGGIKEIGIHIADVTHYIKPGTPLDEEAYKRGNSIYLPDRVIPMLPEKISNEICSLNPREEKKTFSYIFQLTEGGEIKKGKFIKTLIKSNRRFSYEEVQHIIEKKEKKIPEEISITKKEEKIEESIFGAILFLNKLSQKRREERKKRGTISFEKKEIEYLMSEKNQPEGIKIKTNKEANQLVEELMLLANTNAAKQISSNKKEKSFIYRTHDKPDKKKLKTLKKIIEPLGYVLNIKGKGLNKQLNKILKESRGKKEENLINKLIIRSMSKAEYSTKNIGHYGLSFSNYTHFTSPIRRYSDIIAHRILSNSQKWKIKEKDLKEKCAHITEREILSTKTEREGNKLMQLKFLENKVGQQKRGFISGVTEGGLFVEIIENMCEGFIIAKELGKERFYFDESKLTLKGEESKRKYVLGDEIEVKVKIIDFKKRQAYFSLI